MFYILETQKQVTWGKCLIELREVIKEVGPLDVNYWLLQDIEQYYGYFFKMDYQDFIRQTLAEPKGFYVSPDEFRIYCNSDMTLADGSFVAINSNREDDPMLVLDNFDSGTWHAATANEVIGERLLNSDWEKSSHFPRMRGFPDWGN